VIVSCCKATGLAASAAWLPFIAPVSSTHLNVGHKWLEPFSRNMHLYLNSRTLGTLTGGQSGLVVFVIMLEVIACGFTHSLKTIRSGFMACNEEKNLEHLTVAASALAQLQSLQI